MTFSHETTRAITYALRRPETAREAAEALRGSTDQAALEGLAELLFDPPSARAAIAAVASLEGWNTPLAIEALIRALDAPHAALRVVALQSLHQRGVEQADSA